MKLSMWKLRLRLWAAMFALFALIYAIILVIASFAGVGSYQIYAFLGIAIVLAQYLAGPKLVEWSMHVKYLSEEEAPDLHRIVGELAIAANIPKPKIGISETPVPNAFAFGRYKKDGRVCVTRGLLNILREDEVKAVLGHELGHIKHNDMIVTTVVSGIPLICYYIGMSFLLSRSDNGNGGLIIGILAFIAYAVGQLIVLFVSRVREYYADEASVEFGNPPEKLASALYKLVYGASKVDKKDIKKVKGSSALFLNNVGKSDYDIREMSELDTDKDGNISASELSQLKFRKVNLSGGEKFMEILSTHPNMLKRMAKLAEYT
ncbi:MAG: M48 family metalloprotease [Methanobrevibacter sp.]|jgi:heat shock protein HtpX|nr:M48 family metalloprotease [Candidatus Methanoflexus mossambicus]